MPTLEFQRIQYAPGHRMPPHVDACRRLSIVLAGQLTESKGSESAWPTTGSVAIKSDDLVHHNRFGPEGADILSVILSDDTLEELELPTGLVHWQWHHEHAPRRMALRLAAAGMRRDAFAAEAALADLARVFHTRPSSDDSDARRELETIRERLHDDPNEELSLRELAREAGVHPVTVGTRFRKAFGCSITEYRQRIRAERAAVALTASQPSLTDVALDHGFFDLSHMSRVFRREFGMPPGAFRKALRPARDRLQSYKTSWSLSV